MKNLKFLLAYVLLSACTQAPESVPRATGHPPAPTPPSKESPSASQPSSTSVSSASAAGVVKGVDARGGRITIAHGPVGSLQWPAMTMTFRTGNVDIGSIRPGDSVTFQFTSTGMHATITSITHQPRQDEDSQ